MFPMEGIQMSWYDPSLLPSGVLVLVAFLSHAFLAGLIHAVAQDAWHVVKVRLRRAGRRIAVWWGHRGQTADRSCERCRR